MKKVKLRRLCAVLTSASVLLGSAAIYGFAAAESIAPGAYDRDDAAKDVAYVSGLTLESKNNTVWGSGIITGTGPFDEQDNEGDENRGDDSSAANTIIRSYDTLTYNVEVNVQSRDGVTTYTSGRVGYQFILPDDPELALDLASMGWVQDLHEDTATIDEVASKIYTVYRDLPTENGHAIPGGCTVPFVLKVGGKKQGDIIRPIVKAWAEGDSEAETNARELTADAVTVTSVPKYNVELVNYSTTLGPNNGWDFKDNVYNSQAGWVAGFEATYGFVLQLRNDNFDKGIRGVEMPLPGEAISFDVELTSTFADVDITADYTPLLWSVAENGEQNQVLQMPMTGHFSIPDSNRTGSVKPGEEAISCKDSGTVTAVQNGSKITFTVKDFEVDMNAFPQTDRSGEKKYYLADGKIGIGCFSAFKFTVIQPIKLTDEEGATKDLKQTHGASGMVQVDAQDQNMQVTSLSETRVNEQTNKNDDRTTQTRDITAAGRRNHEIFYSCPGNVNSGTDNIGNGNKANGSDTALSGAQVGVTHSYSENNIGTEDIDEHSIAVDQLIKFDDRALEVDPTIALSGANGANNDWKWTLKFAAKPDGTGWNHPKPSPNPDDSEQNSNPDGTEQSQDLGDTDEAYAPNPDDPGYDAEMVAAVQEDLVYYNSYEELQSAGAVCVGLLYQTRGCETGRRSLLWQRQGLLKVKADATVANHVYMLHESTNAWLASQFKDEVATFFKKDADALTLADYKAYAQNSQGFDADCSYDTETKAWTTSPAVNLDTAYTKATYDESGYKGGESSGWTCGDSLYIVPYETNVSLLVAQKSSDGKDKQTYDLDQGERYVDFVVASGMSFKENVNISADQTTTVTLTVTLDKGLTYIPNSAVWGGEYAPVKTIGNYFRQGYVIGGEPVEPTISTDEDGNTRLTFIIENVEVKNSELAPLHFSCEIGNKAVPEKDVKGNQSLKGEATISTTEDKRSIAEYNRNVSTDAISVTKLISFNISKITTKTALERNDNAAFQLIINNSSSEAKENICAIDTMPQNGYNFTTIHKDSQYAITSMTLDATALKDPSDIEIWYTDNTAYAGKTSQNISRNDITTENGWKQATITDGNIEGDGLIGSWPVAFAYIDPSLGAWCSAVIDFTYSVTNGHAGDVLRNTFSQEDLSMSAEVKVYTRSLSGKAWSDTNLDGVRDEDEDAGIPGVTVTLYKGDKVVDTTTTDENGDYRFDNLAEGDDYRVEFTGNDLADLKVTEKGQDSKADGEYTGEDNNKTLSKAVITGISLPSLEEMQAKDKTAYSLLNQDGGFGKAVPPTTTTSSTTTTTTTTKAPTSTTTSTTSTTTTTTSTTTSTTSSTASTTSTTTSTSRTTTSTSRTTTSTSRTTTSTTSSTASTTSSTASTTSSTSRTDGTSSTSRTTSSTESTGQTDTTTSITDSTESTLSTETTDLAETTTSTDSTEATDPLAPLNTDDPVDPTDPIVSHVDNSDNTAPQTGEEAHTALFALLLGFATLALAALLAYQGKKPHQQP